MSRIHKALLAFLMAGAAAMAGAETVYKWVDAAGQVHYTDLPPRQAGARILGVIEQGVVDEESGDDYDDEGDDSGSPSAMVVSPAERRSSSERNFIGRSVSSAPDALCSTNASCSPATFRLYASIFRTPASANNLYRRSISATTHPSPRAADLGSVMTGLRR